MEYPTVFHLLAAAFKKAEASFVLVGGFAVYYYKMNLSFQADVLTTEKDYQKALPCLEESDCKQILKKDPFARLRSDNPAFIDLDVRFVKRQTLNKIIKNGQEIKFQAAEFIVSSREQEIIFSDAKKQFPPSKDLSMDNYLKFIESHLKYTFDREVFENYQERRMVNARFSLK